MRGWLLVCLAAAVVVGGAIFAFPLHGDPEFVVQELWSTPVVQSFQGTVDSGRRPIADGGGSSSLFWVETVDSWSVIDSADGRVVGRRPITGPYALGPRSIVMKTAGPVYEVRNHAGELLGTIPAGEYLYLTAERIVQFTNDGLTIRTFAMSGAMQSSFVARVPMTAFGTSADGEYTIVGTLDGQLALLDAQGVRTARIGQRARPVLYAAHLFDGPAEGPGGNGGQALVLFGARPQTAALISLARFSDVDEPTLSFDREMVIPDQEAVQWAPRVWRLRPGAVGVQLRNVILVWDRDSDSVELLDADVPGVVQDLIAAAGTGFIALSRTETRGVLSLIDEFGRAMVEISTTPTTQVRLAAASFILFDGGRAARYLLGYEDAL